MTKINYVAWESSIASLAVPMSEAGNNLVIIADLEKIKKQIKGHNWEICTNRQIIRMGDRE